MRIWHMGFQVPGFELGQGEERQIQTHSLSSTQDVGH